MQIYDAERRMSREKYIIILTEKVKKGQQTTDNGQQTFFTNFSRYQQSAISISVSRCLGD